MNSHNIPECHAFLNKITTILFPFPTWLQSVRPHLGKHEVATITKKQPLSTSSVLIRGQMLALQSMQHQE